MTTCDRPDQARETVNQRVPGLPVSLCGLPQEAAGVDVIHDPTVTTPRPVAEKGAPHSSVMANFDENSKRRNAPPHSQDIIMGSPRQMGNKDNRG